MHASMNRHISTECKVKTRLLCLTAFQSELPIDIVNADGELEKVDAWQ
jgi:hypothetical protein